MTPGAVSLSRFTPSVMSHELLERLFVAREPTLEAILARIAAAATTWERNHSLLVGPRGAGKTHLISLVYHRTNMLRASGVALQAAWLPEDPWTIVSYRHLLRAVVQRLDPKVEQEISGSTTELEAFLASRAADSGPIVVLVENLDQILNALEDHGQQQLRHTLQADRSLLLVATSTRLDRALSDQASPFYGFFTTTRLEPFTIHQAGAMLTVIAKERGDEALVNYLSTDNGRTRLRTIAHLAGGQPRIWSVLASALTVGGLGELVELLLTRFDDLTPYYQEQLGRLSGQQRLVVAELAEVDRPVNVSELAKRLEIGQRSLGKTMSELVDRGWVAPTRSAVTALLDQRRTYYELAEPLARISFQIKESRGEPLRLVVEFLKHWFDPADLNVVEPEGLTVEYMLRATAGQDHDPTVAVSRRLQRLPPTRAPAVALLGEIDDALATLATGDPEPFMRLPAPVRAALEQHLDPRDPRPIHTNVHQAALDEFGHVHHPGMGAWIARAERWIASADGTAKPAAQLIATDWLGRAWRFDEAREVLTAVTDALDPDDPAITSTIASLAASYWSAGRIEDAITLKARVLADRERVLGVEHPDTLRSRANLAVSYWAAGRIEDAIVLSKRVLAECERVLGVEHPDTLRSRANLAVSYWAARDLDLGLLEQVQADQRRPTLGLPCDFEVPVDLPMSHRRVVDAMVLLEHIRTDCERVLGVEHSDTLRSRANLAVSYRAAGRPEDAIALDEGILADSERTLGVEHPDTLRSRAHLAMSCRAAGRVEGAIVLDEEVLADSERVLGVEHPDTLWSRANLADSYWSAGRTEEAILLSERVLADRECVLGVEHPDTLGSRVNLAMSYWSAGRIEDAIVLSERVLAEYERVLAVENRDTACLRRNLVKSYKAAGRTLEAILLFERGREITRASHH